jgi:hypothetical protein
MEDMKIVEISVEESDHLELLYHQFNGYMGVLAYLVNNQLMNEDNPFLKDKWEECVRLSYTLEEEKHELDKKYHPTDTDVNYTTFEFDFYHHQMIYSVG